MDSLKELRELCLLFLGGLVVAFFFACGAVFLNQPVKTTEHRFEWRVEKETWDVSNFEQLPKTIPNGPFFLWGKQGKSFTLTIPYDRLGRPMPARISNETE